MKEQLHKVSLVDNNRVRHDILGEGTVKRLTVVPLGRQVYYKGILEFLGREIETNICLEPISNETLIKYGKDLINYSILPAATRSIVVTSPVEPAKEVAKEPAEEISKSNLRWNNIMSLAKKGYEAYWGGSLS